jgi:hypothetical protein
MAKSCDVNIGYVLARGSNRLKQSGIRTKNWINIEAGNETSDVGHPVGDDG